MGTDGCLIPGELPGSMHEDSKSEWPNAGKQPCQMWERHVRQNTAHLYDSPSDPPA